MFFFLGDVFTFLIPLAAAGGIYYVSRLPKWNLSDLKLAFINFIIIYLLIIGNVLTYYIYLDYKVSTFDLDGDGFFSYEESTPEYAEYSSMLVNDLARLFAPITGFVFSFLCSAIFFIILKFIRIIRQRKIK